MICLKELEDERKAVYIQARLLACAYYLRNIQRPPALQRALDATKSLEALRKYSANQPRVPAGNPDGGQWVVEDRETEENTSVQEPKRTVYAEHKPLMKPAKSLSLSVEGAKELVVSEGYSSKVYLCPAGYPTIGYGHKLLPEESFPNGITREEALKLYIQDMQVAERAVQRYTKVPLYQGQFDALVSFTYNEGQGKYRTSTLLRLLNQEKYREAANEFPKWNKIRDRQDGKLKPDKGLTRRRRREQKLFLRDLLSSFV